jgi:hypothetical protein
MTKWLSLTNEQRRITLEQASVRSGIQVKAIEKDWWVTLCLKALFSSEYASYCIFKGGTSLSKGWKLIERFSEDIDIALDSAVFGMEYITSPTHSYVKRLKRKGCAFTSTLMKQALEKAFTIMEVPQGKIVIEAEEVPEGMPDKDPQTLLIRYTSLFANHPYLADEVKMEFSVRSLKEPFALVPIRSILSEVFPHAYEETAFEVPAVEPRKTLLEKVFLLHEKLNHFNAESRGDDRQSRHFYDIVQLMETEFGQAALDDGELYTTLIEHRRYYARLRLVNYDLLDPHTLYFVPPIELMEFFRNDYEQMQQAMIYGTTHPFEALMRKIKWYNGKFRLMGTGLLLEDVINRAFEQNQKARLDTGRNILGIPVQMETVQGQCFNYIVTLHRMRGEWIFERLQFAPDASK